MLSDRTIHKLTKRPFKKIRTLSRAKYQCKLQIIETKINIDKNSNFEYNVKKLKDLEKIYTRINEAYDYVYDFLLKKGFGNDIIEKHNFYETDMDNGKDLEK